MLTNDIISFEQLVIPYIWSNDLKSVDGMANGENPDQSPS